MAFLGRVKVQVRSLLLFRLRLLRVYEALLAVEHALLGRKVRLEACSTCQLKCPLCPTVNAMSDWRSNHQEVIGWGSLKADDFRRFVKENGRFRTIELSNWGEILLNRELVEILKCAHEQGISLQAANGVNLNAANDAMLEALVLYRFEHLSVSIDGASDETYRIYRKNGKLERVLGYVDRINHFKRLHGSEYPRLTWQFVIFGHNEHELPKARRMAEERGMSFRPVMNLDDSYSPVKDPAFVERETGIRVERNVAKAVEGFGQDFVTCSQMWDGPQINWDGKLLGCCFNNIGDYGNVFQQGLKQALASERFVYAKKMILGLAPPREDIPCSSCPVYRGTPYAAEAASMPRAAAATPCSNS